MTTAPQVKAAMVTLLRSAFAADSAVSVWYGDPDSLECPDIIGVMGVSGEQEPGPMGGLRKRDEQLQVAITVSCYVGGFHSDAQQSATERAYALLQSIETALRSDPSLGGLVYSSALTGFESAEAIAYDSDPEAPRPIGRICEITGFVACKART